MVVRLIVMRGVMRQMTPGETRRRWIVNIRNAVVLLAILGLGAIWAAALRPVAVSILALGAAFVLATRELFQCATAALVRTMSRSFSVGDRIEIGTIRGDVIDQTLFATTILEVGPGRQHLRTGRTIIFPNSKLLEMPVINESYMEQYVVHVFHVPAKLEPGWQETERMLLEAANEVCAPFLAEASDHMARMEQRHGLTGLPVRPRVYVDLPDEGKLAFLVRVPAPVGRQGRIEQEIVRRFLQDYLRPGAGPTAVAPPEEQM